jgi:hypothetical protein
MRRDSIDNPVSDRVLGNLDFQPASGALRRSLDSASMKDLISI